MSEVSGARRVGGRADARRNREKVVRAAAEMFARHGLAAQMQDVAHQAGVGLGTVYRHFPTKERLAAELVSASFDRMTEQVIHARNEPGDPWDRLVAALRANLAELAADAGTRAAMAGGAAVDLDHWEPAWLRHRAALDELLADAHADGTLHDDFSVDDLGMMLCGMSAAMDSRSNVGWERQLRFVLRAIRASPRDHSP